MSIRIGIDPGKSGFISACSGNIVSFPIPLIGKEVDFRELDNLIKSIGSESVYCVLEDVHAMFEASAKATFSFGYVCGGIEAILIANGIPYTKVAPKKWQKQMWEGIPIQKKPSSTGKTLVTDTKKMSLLAVKRIFPNEDLRATQRSKKPHDGKVDSLLLMEYCRRNF